MIDESGYPTEELIQSIRGASTAKEALDLAREYFDASGYGCTACNDLLRVYEFRTGGWSGCEDVIRELMHQPYTMACWELSQRGGKHVFVIPNGL